MAHRKSIISNERGYTLIEMLAVLFIVSTICFIVFQFSHKKIEDYTYRKTIDQLELTIRAAQMQAIEEQVPIYCNIIEEKLFYIHRGYYIDPIYTQTLPEGMTAFIGTANNRISFNTTGNVYNSGKFRFIVRGKPITYSVNLGKGRFLLLE